MDLIKLATMFRFLNLYSHQAHNLASGPSFFSDHAFFGELYSFADDCYDSLIERSIGTGNKKVKLEDIIKKCLDEMEGMDASYFETCQIIIKEILEEIKNSKSGYSDGTLNLIQGMADKLEDFSYKIQQRIS